MKKINSKKILSLLLLFSLIISIFNPLITNANSEKTLSGELLDEEKIEDNLTVGDDANIEIKEEDLDILGDESEGAGVEQIELMAIAPQVPTTRADASNLVNISGVDVHINDVLFIENGIVVNENIHPTVGNSIKFTYYWSISKENLSQINLGDLIYFDLPTEYFTFDDAPTRSPVKDGDGNVLGELWIADSKIVVELNQTALGKDSLENGYVSAKGRISKAGEDIEINTGGVVLPPITINPGGSADPEVGLGDEPPVSKYGFQVPNKNEIYWSAKLNYDNAKKRFNGEPYETLTNAFFVDKLSEGQTFNNLEIKTILHHATSEGKMSQLVLDYTQLASFTNPAPFEKVTAAPNDTVETLMDTLKTEGKPAFGVVNNKDVVIYFGNIPNNLIKLPGFVTANNYANLKQRLSENLAAGKINQGIHDKTIEHYVTNKAEEIVIGYEIVIRANVDGSKDNEDIKNEAKLIYGDKKEEIGSWGVKFQDYHGGVSPVEPGTVEINKVDDSDKPLAGIGFRLDIWDEVSGKYVEKDTLPLGYTDENGKLSFTKLSPGKYKIVEFETLPGYGEAEFENGKDGTFEITGNDTVGFRFKIVNPKDTPDTVDISGKKTWDHGDNPVESQPKQIIVHLYQNGNKIHADMSAYNKVVTAEDNWTYTWTGLPKYDDDGEEYIYTIEEVAIPNYNGVVTNYDIKNTYVPPTTPPVDPETDVEVEKIWDDANDMDGLRPNKILVQLYKNGIAYKDVIELNRDNNWKYKWEALPKYEDDKRIDYTVREIEIPDGYVARYGEDRYGVLTITNIHNPKEPPVTPPVDPPTDPPIEPPVPPTEPSVDIEGEKTWIDEDNRDGLRPKNIVVNLLADNVMVGYKVVSEDSNGRWKYVFKDYPKYKNGKLINYSIEEIVPEGYIASYRGYDIVNRYNTELTNLTARKIWDDENNKFGIRADSIKIQLYGDGVKIGDTIKLSEENNWIYTWTDLPKYIDGELVKYVVDEINVPNDYEVIYDYSVAGTVKITNKYVPVEPPTPEKPELPVDPPVKPPTTPEEPVLPKTGVVDMTLFILLGATMMVLGGILFRKKNKI